MKYLMPYEDTCLTCLYFMSDRRETFSNELRKLGSIS